MAIERTLSIIKPDATERNMTGLIVSRLEAAGLRSSPRSACGGGRRTPRNSTRCTKGSRFTRSFSTI